MPQPEREININERNGRRRRGRRHTQRELSEEHKHLIRQNKVEWKNKKSDFNAITKNAYHFTPYLKNKYHKFRRNIVRLCDYDTLKTLLHAIFHRTTYFSCSLSSFVRWCTCIFGISWSLINQMANEQYSTKSNERKNDCEFHGGIANQMKWTIQTELFSQLKGTKNHMKSFCVYWSNGEHLTLQT